VWFHKTAELIQYLSAAYSAARLLAWCRRWCWRVPDPRGWRALYARLADTWLC